MHIRSIFKQPQSKFITNNKNPNRQVSLQIIEFFSKNVRNLLIDSLIKINLQINDNCFVSETYILHSSFPKNSQGYASLMKIEEPLHPNADHASFPTLLELGFRPLYLCGALWALIGVGFGIFAPHLLSTPLNGMLWQAHEILWGFIPAIVIGFLLTATNNWTGINPLKEIPLAMLTVLWLAARLFFLAPEHGLRHCCSLRDHCIHSGQPHDRARPMEE